MEGKKSRINNTTDLFVDRISALPDFILGHILSFLPTNKAVATSILSKRWKFAWVTVHSLDFFNGMDEEDEEEDNEEKITEFVRFVNRVLLLNGSGSLDKFSLSCLLLSISPQIISWINTAITRNVRHLYLSVGGDNYVLTTSSLFSCDSLRSLDLCGFVSIHDTTAICLPRLESLQLDHVRFESKEAFEKLISGCPILHNLKLFMQGDASAYIISSASLRRLDICFVNRVKLKLKASSLEYLRLRGCISDIFVEKSLSSLVEAYFDVWLKKHDTLNNSIVEAVRAFDCAKFLTLSTDVMRALSRATISLSTEFKRLVKLVAPNYCCPLQDFIQNSDNLEELICQHSEWPRTVDHPRWATVPRCLSNSLKKVCFRSYNGSEDERDMICYMLKYGSVLEVMHISCNKKGDGEKLMLLKEISEFPRKSPVCKVQFF